MRAIVKLLPGMADMSSAMGSQMRQAFGALGMNPGGKIPVDIPEGEENEFVVDGAVRSEVTEGVVKFLDEKDRERAIVPLFRIDTVRFEE